MKQKLIKKVNYKEREVAVVKIIHSENALYYLEI